MRQRLHECILRGLIVAVLAGGCDGNGDETGSETTASEMCSAETAPSWENFGEEFFTKYCNACHSEAITGDARNGAPFDQNFDTPELVRMQIARIRNVAAAEDEMVNTFMPPGDPKPSEAERVTLGEWLDCGAP